MAAVRYTVALLVLLAVAGALANEVFVGMDGVDSASCGAESSPCATIGQALLLVTDEGTITLTNGTYSGAGNVGQTVAPVGVTFQSTEAAVVDLGAVAAGGAGFYCSSDVLFVGITFSGLVGDASAVVLYDGSNAGNVTLDVVSFDGCTFEACSGSYDIVTTATAHPCSTYWNDVTFAGMAGDWAVVECDASAVEGVCIARADAMSFNACSSTRAHLISIACNGDYIAPQLIGTLSATGSTFPSIISVGRYCFLSVSGADITDSFFSAPIIDSESVMVDVVTSTVAGCQALNGTDAAPLLRVSAQTEGGLVGDTKMQSISMTGNFGVSLVHVEMVCSEYGFCQEMDTSFTLTDTQLFSNNFPAVEEGEVPFAMVHVANMTHIFITDLHAKGNHQADNDGIVVRIETYSNANVTVDLANMSFENNTVVPMGLGLAAFGEVSVQMSHLSFTDNNNRQAVLGLLAEDFVIVEASMQNVTFTNNFVAEADDEDDIVLDAGVLYCANGKSQAAVTLDLVSAVSFEGNNATAIVNEDCTISCGESLEGLCDNAEEVDSNPGLDVTIFVLVVVTVGMALTIVVIIVVVYLRERKTKAEGYADVDDYAGSAVLIDEEEEGTVVY